MSSLRRDEGFQPSGEKRRPHRLADVKAASAELIARKGYKDTAISDIAEALGVRKSTVYHHVQSKEQLLFWIIQDYMKIGDDIIAAAEANGPSALGRLEALITEHLAAMASHPVEASIVAQELRSLEGEYRVEAMRTRDAYDSYLEHLIMEGQEAGEFDETIDARLAALGILSMMNGTHIWYRPDGPKAANEIAAGYTKILLSGLAT